jgi:PKD domain
MQIITNSQRAYSKTKTKTKGNNPKMKNSIWFKLSGAALLGLMIFGVAVPSGQTATTVTSVTLAAVVQNQQCQGGDSVNVTFTATLNPPAPNVQYQWDFNNDGIFDTPLSPDPTVTHVYPDETNVTAVVKVVKGRRSATDSVTFSTMRCGG